MAFNIGFGIFSPRTCNSQEEEKLLPFAKSWMWVSIAIPFFR